MNCSLNWTGGGGADFEDKLTYDLIIVLNYTCFVRE
jgi:hypothetical protein